MAEKSFSYEEIEKIANDLLAQVKCRPKLGIVCGSGLGKLGDLVEDKEVIPYSDIPGFPISTVPGHDGKLIFGTLSGRPVVLMKGRSHCYEGYSVQKTTVPIRTMKLMGVTTLFVTNAAGGINKDFNVGDIMIIKDHMNLAGFAGVNPLVGPNDERFGPRFPAVSKSYDLELRKQAMSLAKELGYGDFIREGVYCMLVGPSYETVTECRFLNLVGVDATGMSTVSEVIAAKHCGMRVFGMSLITNKCIQEYDSQAIANHEEVLASGEKRSKDLLKLVKTLVAKMDDL